MNCDDMEWRTRAERWNGSALMRSGNAISADDKAKRRQAVDEREKQR